MQKIKQIGARLNTRVGKVSTAITVTAGTALAYAGTSGATTPTLDEQFDSGKDSIMTELGKGGVLIVGITLFIVGITILVRVMNKGSKKTPG